MNPIYEATITLDSYDHRKIQFDNYDQNLKYTGYDISNLYHKTPNIPGLYAVGKNLHLVSAIKTGNNSKFNFEKQFHFYSKDKLKIDEEYINIVEPEDQLKEENKSKPLNVQLCRNFNQDATLAKILMCTQTTEQFNSDVTPLWCITAVIIGIGIKQPGYDEDCD